MCLFTIQISLIKTDIRHTCQYFENAGQVIQAWSKNNTFFGAIINSLDFQRLLL